MKFKELEVLWYQKLKDSGFDDCESTSSPGRPLKEWHSLKFTSENTKIRRATAEKYFNQVDAFNNYEELYEICCLISMHYNSTLWPEDVKDIIDLHRSGLTERRIAKEVGRGKKCVHLTLKKVREWMKVV